MRLYKETSIKIESDEPIDSFILEDLSGRLFTVKNNSSLNLKNQWLLLKVPYLDKKIEITEIYIDGCPLLQVLYTGYFENTAGKCVQPCTAVFEPGYFKIWIHPSVGHMKAEIINQISNNDYGKNLFDKYLLTVDRPVILPDDFPVELQEFFSYAVGPKWWNKNSTKLPYKELDESAFVNMINDVHIIESLCEHDDPISDRSRGWSIKSWATNPSAREADPVQFDRDSFHGFGQYFSAMGYQELFSFHIAELGPMGYIHLHIDDYVGSKNLKHIRGATKFYQSYSNADDVYFKLNGVGCIPIHKPLLINVNMFSHAVVNLSADKTRKTLGVTGIL